MPSVLDLMHGTDRRTDRQRTSTLNYGNAA